MSNKVATNNIFASLADDSDNEAPVKTTTATKVATEAKPAQSKAAHSNTRGHRERKEGDNTEEKVHKDNSQRPKHLKEGVKSKGVPAEPHPQDRKSGTGFSGVDKKKFRKDGGGRGNYGTIKGEVEQIKEEPVEEVEAEPEVVDNTITVNEYFEKMGYGKEEVKKVPERQLNHEELKREKLQVVQSKTEKVIATTAKVAGQKKNKGPTTYSIGCNTENSELLGVKTGHTTLKYKVEKEGDELVGSIVEKKRDNNTNNRDFKDNKDKKPFNKNKKVNVENESDFPKLA